MWDSLMNTKEKYTGFSLRGSLWEEGFVGKGPRLLGLIPQVNFYLYFWDRISLNLKLTDFGLAG